MSSAIAQALLQASLTQTRHPVQTRGSDIVCSGIVEFTRRLAIHEEEAFREFHALYFDRLYQFLLTVARGQEHEAQEALQETMLRVARRARVCDNEEEFWCWLKTVARNAARDGGRKRGRYAALLQRFSLWRRADLAGDGASETRLQQALAESLAELPPDERQLVQDKYLDGDSVRDLAERSGLTEKAVESRLLRLRRQLRERLLRKLNER